MKNIKHLYVFFFLLSIQSLHAQFAVEFQAGFSDYIFSDKTGKDIIVIEEIFDETINFNPQFSWKISLDRKMPYNNFDCLLGLTFFSVKAENSFFDEWQNTYAGLHLGLGYNIKKFRIGIHSSPAINTTSSIQIISTGGGLSGEKKSTRYNIDLSPNIGFNLNETFQIRLNYHHGLNDALKTGEGKNYKINMFLLGLRYSL